MNTDKGLVKKMGKLPELNFENIMSKGGNIISKKIGKFQLGSKIKKVFIGGVVPYIVENGVISYNMKAELESEQCYAIIASPKVDANGKFHSQGNVYHSKTLDSYEYDSLLNNIKILTPHAYNRAIGNIVKGFNVVRNFNINKKKKDLNPYSDESIVNTDVPLFLALYNKVLGLPKP